MATCVDVGGASYLKEHNDKPIKPMEGKSLVTAFKNEPIEREALYWEHEGNAAIRVGDLKLVRKGRESAWELYDMKADRTELHDLATAQPEKANELAAQWDTWAERAQVKPYPGNYNLGEGSKKKGKGKKKTK
jgi:arylsulfatase